MKLDPKNLIDSLKRDDNTCLKDIFLAHSDYCIKNLQKKTSCSPEDADDIFVDAIINFRERLLNGKIEYLTNLRAYIFSTCYNMWLAKYRKDRVHEINAEDIRSFYEEPDLSNLEKEGLIDLVNKAIFSLGDKCQRIIKLFYFGKMSMIEIADEMKFASAGVAKTIKARCFKKLIDEVKKQISQNQVYSD